MNKEHSEDKSLSSQLTPEANFQELIRIVENEPTTEELKAEAARLWDRFIDTGQGYNEEDKEAALSMAKARLALKRLDRYDVLFDLLVAEEENKGDWSTLLLDSDGKAIMEGFFAMNSKGPYFASQLENRDAKRKIITLHTYGGTQPSHRKADLEIAGEALRHLGINSLRADSNIFRVGSQLVKVGEDLQISPLTKSTLRIAVSEVGITLRDRENLKNEYGTLPANIIDTILSLHDYPGFRELRSIARHPLIAIDGRVIQESGYDNGSKVFIGSQSKYRTDKDPIEAARHIMEEVLFAGDGQLLRWPFLTPAGRANAFGYLITPFIRPLVPLAPMALFLRKSNAGTGTSLLNEVLLSVSQGPGTSGKPMNISEVELGKLINESIRDGKEYIWFNNVRRNLKSQVLEDFLTATTKARKRKSSIDNTLSLSVCGDESAIIVTKDMRRRTYSIVLKAPDEYPSLRKGFKHDTTRDPIQTWVLEHRRELIEDILSMAAAWHREGSPMLHKGPVIGDFDTWCRTIGSILAFSGVPGFLDNVDYTKDLDKDSMLMVEFFKYWFNTKESEPLVATEVVAMIEKTGDNLPLPKLISDAMEKKKPQTSISMALKALVLADNAFDGLKIKSDDSKKQRNVQAYWIEPE
jgi:hypothetical protein